MNEDIVIPIGFFLAIFGILYIYLSSRNKERLAMIDKGFDPVKFKTRPESSSINTLKWSLLLIGVAVGVFLGAVISEYAGFPEEAAYFSFIFLFGGIGLLVSYFIEKKENK